MAYIRRAVRRYAPRRRVYRRSVGFAGARRARSSFRRRRRY